MGSVFSKILPWILGGASKLKPTPGMMGPATIAAPSAFFTLDSPGTDSILGPYKRKDRAEYDKRRSSDSAGTAAPAQTMDAFQKSMAKSVTTAATEEDDEEENPFNYNQLFIASILKGLKQKPPATAGGRASGTYIPKPELPRMSDYDSNKTYWNIG